MTRPSDDTTGRARLFLPVRWLISPGYDTCWILGSVLVSYAMFAAWKLGLVGAGPLTLFWIFFLHGPHFWGTVSRTWLDRQERSRRRGLLRVSLLWFLAGPIMVGASIWLEPASGRPGGQAGGIELLFLVLAATWAYHHVVKQHFGFMALYRAKALEFDRLELRLHRWYVVWSLWLPAIVVLTNNLWWVLKMPWIDVLRAKVGDAAILAGMADVQAVCTWAFVALQILYLLHLARRIFTGRGINLPETLVVLCAVPLHWVVLSALFTTSGVDLDNVVFVPILTAFHNIQYQGLIWHYNRRYRSGAEPDAARYGLAVRLNRNIWLYLACGVLFATLTIGWNHYAASPEAGRLQLQRPGSILVGAFVWGFSFAHYYLDSKIWKVSQDEDLRQSLGFEPRHAGRELPVPPVEEPVHA